MEALFRTREEMAAIYHRNVQTVYRVCMVFFRGCTQDAEDAVQTTFLKLMRDGTAFRSAEHEKAWLIVTASNVCRDMLRTAWRRRVDMDMDAVERRTAPEWTDETLESIFALPEQYKAAIYLHYYEGYSCAEIARHMKKSEATVWRYLRHGRMLLKTAIGEDR